MNEVVAWGNLRRDSAGVDVLLKVGDAAMKKGFQDPRRLDKFTTHRRNGIMYENGNYLPGRQGSLTWRPSQHICAPDREKNVR